MSASAPFLLPIDTAPMEAKRADAIPVEQGVWQYEPKWDGFRCLSFKTGNAVDIRAKSGKPLARYFPELVDRLCNLPAAQFVIDGEILIERTGNYSFDALQMRLHPAESRIRKLAVETPAKLMVFDMLADPTGQVLTDRPLSGRRAALERLVRSIGSADIQLSPATLDLMQAKKWLQDSGGNTDGVIAKRLR